MIKVSQNYKKEKIEYCAVIKYFHLKGMTSFETHEIMVRSLTDNIPSDEQSNTGLRNAERMWKMMLDQEDPQLQPPRTTLICSWGDNARWPIIMPPNS